MNYGDFTITRVSLYALIVLSRTEPDLPHPYKPFAHKKKPAEASSVPMYYQCFNQIPSAHAICVVRRCVNRPTYSEVQTQAVATIYE
jgi:hypothetical protein